LVRANQLYLLSLGHLVNQDPNTRETPEAQVPAYLIRTARGRNILIDTGNPISLVGAENAAPWAPGLGVVMRPEDDVVAQLGKLGLRPKDIDLLVSTHFDFDHCGRHDAFAEAGVPVVVQRSHYDSAVDRPKRYDPALWNIPGWEYQFVDGDVQIEQGVVLIETSGHAVGHQSVYVETAHGNVLLAIDAIAHASDAQVRPEPDSYPGAVEANKSIDKLMQWALEYHCYTIFGHEWSQWQTLPHGPRAFSR
jgi:N-acyl homoserine lactone hydrolase